MGVTLSQQYMDLDGMDLLIRGEGDLEGETCIKIQFFGLIQ
jgi:hypothetical protein